MTLLDTLLISGVKYSQIMGHVGKSISLNSTASAAWCGENPRCRL